MVFVCMMVIQVIKYTLNKGNPRPIGPILFFPGAGEIGL